MTSVKFTHGYFGQIVHWNGGDVAQAEDILRCSCDLFELIDVNSPLVKAYFDIESTALPVDFPILTSVCMALGFAISGDPTLQPLSVCTSSGYVEKDGKSMFKHSYHVLYNFHANRVVWKNIAIEANKFLALFDIPPLCDTKVYHSRQLLRAVFSTKPNDSRTKTIQSADYLYDTFVTYLGTSQFYVNTCTTSTDGYVKLLQLMSPQLASNFDTWVQFGMALAYQCQSKNLSPLIAFECFLRFSRLHNNPSCVEDCFQKFIELLNTRIENELIETLKRKVFEVDSTEECDFDFPRYITQYILIQCAGKPVFNTVKLTLSAELFPFVLVGYDNIKKAYKRLRYGYNICMRENIELPFIDSDDFEVTKQLYAAFNYPYVAENVWKQIDEYLKDDEEHLEMNMEYEKQVKTIWTCIMQILSQQEKALFDEITEATADWLCPLNIGDSGPNDIYDKFWTWKNMHPKFATQFPYYTWITAIVQKCRNLAYLPFYINRTCAQIFAAEKVFHFLCYVVSDLDAACIIYRFYPFWSCDSSSAVFVYDDTKGIWTNSENVQYMIISRISPLMYQPLAKGLRVLARNFTLNNASLKGVLFRMKTLPEVLRASVSFEDMKQSSEEKLLFPNGYYDGSILSFRPCLRVCDLDVEYLKHDKSFIFTHPELYFFATMPDSYTMNISSEVTETVQEMKQLLFYNMHGKEVGEYHMESLALGLMGVKYKGFYVHVGETNSGKSTEKSLLESTFGDYVGTGNTDDFAMVKDDRRESALVNAPAFENWYKRLVLYSERSERVLNTEMLKSYASGGEDKIRARTQYKSAVVFSIHFTMIFYVNDMLRVSNPDDAAYIDRARAFYWSKSYVPKEKLSNPIQQMEANDEVRLWKTDPMRRKLFCFILLEAYRSYKTRGNRLPVPRSVILSTSQQVGSAMQADELFEKLMHEFLFTGNTEDYVPREIIQATCSKLGLSANRCTMKINSIMSTLNISTIGSKQKKIRGTLQNVWFGVLPRGDSYQLSETSPLVDYDQWVRLMRAHNNVISPELIAKLQEWRNWTESNPMWQFLTAAQLTEMNRRVRMRTV